MIGAGTIINPIVKIVTTVVILGAVYLFIVRPVLDTTENVVDRTARQFEESQRAAAARSAAFDVDFARSRLDSYESSLGSSWPAAAREVRACARDAGNAAKPLERCVDRAQAIVHSVQSDRNFATSYADSLASQGRSADAARVRDCVEDAAYDVGPMQRCRDLADRLLFG